MATASIGFKSREDHRKQLELEEARKAGLVPAEVDEDGKEINPHVPRYMSSAPWYLINSSNADHHQKPSLKHQRKWKSPPMMPSSSSDQNSKSTFKAEKFRKGSCENCGAMTHNYKSCTDRPRKIGAKWTNKNIAADEKIKTETIIFDYDGKRDRWICDHDSTYPQIIEKYETRDEARRKYLKEKQSKQLDEEEFKLIDERASALQVVEEVQEQLGIYELEKIQQSTF